MSETNIAAVAALASTSLAALATQVVSSYIAGRGDVDFSEVPSMLKDVHSTLSDIENGVSSEPEDELIPAVAINKSVKPDYIVCLEDGKKFKMLKRHLSTTYNMTPEDYRQRWGLPTDYPMVSPNYASRRSELAKQIGLGRKPGKRAAKAA